MLPSRGYFKKNDCPFFEKGLCVRPHCHFRHKKKVISENSSSTDSQDELLLSDSLYSIALVKNSSSEDSLIDTASSNKLQHSSNDIALGKNESSENSLFAKLVNQSNPYEKISRHIPCAYTPTPQIKGVQPKNKTVGLKNGDNNSKDVLHITQTISDGYKMISIASSDNSFVTNLIPGNSNISNSDKLVSNQSAVSIPNSENNKLFYKNSECKIPFFDNSTSDCYEPQSTTATSFNSSSQENKNNDYSSDYVPSKVVTTESQYVPNCSNSSLSFSYIPSKDKSKHTQYVPEPTGSIKNEIRYKPSDKTKSGETQYQPGTHNIVANYVPTEKSATKTSSSWLGGNGKNDLIEIEFISSEIEMMKELLKDEANGKKTVSVESTSKTESLKEKPKEEKPYKKKHKSSRNHHRSSSNSKSSNFYSSSSKMKSPRHHSCNNSSLSDRRRNFSDKHRKSTSSSHSKSRHHSSRKSEKRIKSEGYEKKEKSGLENKKAEEKCESNDEYMSDGVSSDFGENLEKEQNSDIESESSSKKRKYEWKSEDRKFKFLKKEAEELFEDLEEDPDTVEKECREIFNSYSSTTETNPTKKPNEIFISTEEYESAVHTKKRTAHSTTITSDHSILRHKTSKTARHSIKSAQEVMLERYKAVEKAKETQTLQPPPPPPPLQSAPVLGLNRPPIKIAAVSNIQQMLQAKKAIEQKISQGMKVNERTTIAQTVAHGSSRVAHTPAARDKAEMPTVSGGTKQVPRIKRQIYLDKLLLETNQIYPTKSESAEEALRMEEEVFRSNSGSSPAYHAAFVSMLLRTRRRVAALKGETSKSTVSHPKMSHYNVLSGGKKNFSVIKAKKVDMSMLTDRHIYEELLRCKLTPEELKENGYPMEGDRPGYAICSLNFELKYNDKYLHIKKMTGNIRYCIRCSKQYEVDSVTLKQFKEGPETCCYHPGKKKSGGRNSDRIYNCCNSASSEGCTTHVRHVTDCNDYEKLPNCVKTLSKEEETNPGVFALDCEMVYTRLGYELARVTVVNLKKEIVYDTLVKPKHPIECFNTFYSGIEEKMMEGVETTLKDVQAVLLSMFSDKTILIGHSLDSDLRALHLIHDTVVDTAVVYKNEKYHPYKYSLKDLCAKKISKIIQDNVGGHDSAEDAVAALEIMLNHVKEEVSKYDSLSSYEADRSR